MKHLEGKKVDLKLAPEEVASCLTHTKGMVFLDSSGNLPCNYKPALSIIAINPCREFHGSDLSELQQWLDEYECGRDVDIPDYIPLGGLFGWIEYEGEFCFGLYENCLIYEHGMGQWYEVGQVISQMQTLEPAPIEVGSLSSKMMKRSYMAKVNRIKQYISAGDIYQVNLAQKFSTPVRAEHLFALYLSLRESAPAPMAAYVNLGGREILSSSPETFISIAGRRIETRPIKGTRPRFDEPERDAESAHELETSEKERAELVMITDLGRNDIGQVCEYGSVKVDEMLQLEKLEHVYHLVSTVTGRLRQDVSHLQAVEACFPGGSITGAPKKRAMEIIVELEDIPRGVYTGAIGYIGFNQVSQFSIVIRTMVRQGGELHYHVGAGIVADSDAEAEYEETLQKAKGMKRALDSLKSEKIHKNVL